MKSGVLLYLLFFSICINAQSDSSQVDLVIPPDSTEIGAPDGKSASKQIGISGGSIVSEDGRIELIFPVGALTEIQTIRIQPTINHAPNGAGKSYWFEPSGIQFNKSVQIVFHYSEEDAETCPPDLMCLGIQGKNGKWSFTEYEEIDTIAKTLKGLIHHFSGGSNVYKVKLEAAKNRLSVKETTDIRVSKYFKGYEFRVDAIIRSGRPVVWYVNKIEMGNSSVGFISAITQKNSEKNESVHSADYTAPDFIIPKNPVTISAELYVPTGNSKVYMRSATLSCKIEIYDVYQVTVKFTAEFPGANDTHLSDTSSFFVWVFSKHIVIDNIKNYPPYISKSGKGPCNLIIFTQNYNGHVHLNDGFKNFKLSKDHPPEVFFEFLPFYETSLFQFQWICKKVPPSPREVLYGVPISPEINFIANGLIQHINFTRYGTEYKIIVKPYRPEKPI